MCQYWKKQYTCGHFSKLFLDMCRPGRVANRVCPDMSDEDESRKSYFLCFDCIRQEARSEYEAQLRAAHEAVIKNRESQQQALRQKQLAEHRAKEERIRREARDKAAREREEEAKAKLLMEEEQERVKKEGGLWIETGSGRKGRHRRNAPGLDPPIPPANHLPVRNIFSRDRKENEGKIGSSSQNDVKRLDATGRAGVWGPKKILTRSDNGGKSENGAVKK